MSQQHITTTETRQAWNDLGAAFIEAVEELTYNNEDYGTPEEWEEQDFVEEDYYNGGLYD